MQTIAISGVLALMCPPVAAQNVSQAELAECAAKPSDAEKLACYQALTSRPAPGDPPAESPESAAPVVVDAEPAAPANVADDGVVEQSAPVQAVIETEATVSIAVAAKPAVESRAAPPTADAELPAATSGSQSPDDLGMEHLDIDDDKPAPVAVTATVSDVTESHTGRLYFHFTNGQVWRQIEPRRFRYPKDETFEVTITQGLMGDYRLRIDGNGPMTRIRRVE